MPCVSEKEYTKFFPGARQAYWYGEPLPRLRFVAESDMTC